MFYLNIASNSQSVAGSEYDSMDAEVAQSDDSDYVEGSELDKRLEDKYERQYSSSEGLQQTEPAASDVPSCQAPALPPTAGPTEHQQTTTAEAAPSQAVLRSDVEPTLRALCSLGVPVPVEGFNMVSVSQTPLAERDITRDEALGGNTGEGSHAESNLLTSVAGNGSLPGPQPKHHTVDQMDVDRSPESNDSGEQADSAGGHSHESVDECVKERIDGKPNKKSTYYSFSLRLV